MSLGESLWVLWVFVSLGESWWVLVSLGESWWVLVSLSESKNHWDSPRLIETQWYSLRLGGSWLVLVGLGESCWVLLSLVESWWVLVSLGEFYWVLLSLSMSLNESLNESLAIWFMIQIFQKYIYIWFFDISWNVNFKCTWLNEVFPFSLTEKSKLRIFNSLILIIFKGYRLL